MHENTAYIPRTTKSCICLFLCYSHAFSFFFPEKSWALDKWIMVKTKFGYCLPFGVFFITADITMVSGRQGSVGTSVPGTLGLRPEPLLEETKNASSLFLGNIFFF